MKIEYLLTMNLINAESVKFEHLINQSVLKLYELTTCSTVVWSSCELTTCSMVVWCTCCFFFCCMDRMRATHARCNKDCAVNYNANDEHILQFEFFAQSTLNMFWINLKYN